MIIETSRFGQLEVDESRLITFEEGILGFPQEHHYAMVQTGPNSGFYWLQSVETPHLAFVVCDPRLFVADYQVPVREEELGSIELKRAGIDESQVLVIVNKVDDMLTGNFQGPLVVNIANRKGLQLVLSDRRYSSRHPLMRVPKKDVISKTA